MTDNMRTYSDAAWRIASLYSHILASETRDLAAHIDAAFASIRREEREKAWQPIENVPQEIKDNQDTIIICSDLEIDDDPVWAVSSGSWCTDCWRDDSGIVFGECETPKYWMPMPKPPLCESDQSPKGGDLLGSVHAGAVLEEHSPNLRSRTPTEAPDHD